MFIVSLMFLSYLDEIVHKECLRHRCRVCKTCRLDDDCVKLLGGQPAQNLDQITSHCMKVSGNH